MGFFNKKLAHPEFNTTMVLLQVQGDYYYFSRVICPNRVIPPCCVRLVYNHCFCNWK